MFLPIYQLTTCLQDASAYGAKKLTRRNLKKELTIFPENLISLVVPVRKVPSDCIEDKIRPQYHQHSQST